MSKNVKDTEMEFKNNFFIRSITPEDKNSVLTILLEEFLITEPMNCATGITKDQINKIFQHLINNNFVMHNSFGAYTKDGQLVGIRLVDLTKREDSEYNTINKMTENCVNEEIVNLPPDILITRILNEAKVDIWKEIPMNINTLVRTEIVCVAKNWQRRGIAKRLELEGNKILKNKFPELQGVIAEATSVANQTLLKKEGYQTYRKTYFKQFNIPCGYDGSDHIETMIKLF
ncbi:Acyl-CoA N-acyltransferase domain-containing protein [Strongyloides ratti]|uniref:Acyl-CoA N-acyltransferase domain-containing protein n=1 Tax=Strongyloides ratti TaxID=34506 RepID=A0A090LDJ0_STRRB|nr:Acyl-CoA N-acyltransferase domain-containing protein [Strongyloides ratti]CEF67832.1 Acyl-CoA N-acyltransferase domain-containing protein [Strongyloides ratti]